MDRLDEIWSPNNAFNVFKLSEFRKYFPGSDIERELNEKIETALTASANHKKNTGLIKDGEVKFYQTLVDEITEADKKQRHMPTFDVILAEPKDSSDAITEKLDFPVSVNGIIYIIATKINLESCMVWMQKVLKFTYHTYYFYKDRLIIVGTKGKFIPDNLGSIDSRDDLYEQIIISCPNKAFHEIHGENSPNIEPNGWEIPIGRTVSMRQELAEKQLIIDSITQTAKKANLDIEISNLEDKPKKRNKKKAY